MADEELSPAQKLAIGSNFVLNSPPAQVDVVMEGARMWTSLAPTTLFYSQQLHVFSPDSILVLDALP